MLEEIKVADRPSIGGYYQISDMPYTYLTCLDREGEFNSTLDKSCLPHFRL